MARLKKENPSMITQTDDYKWIYDKILSRTYDLGLKIGLTPIGERVLRLSVFHIISPLVRRGDKILDMCCGTATLTIELAALLYPDCQIYGIDISKGQIQQAWKKNTFPNLRFIVMDANSTDFNDDFFNIIIISAALHEMKGDQRLNVLNEGYRILKKGGYLLVFDHHEPKQVLKRLLYNFYLGFSERLFSHSADMQKNILNELKITGFEIIEQCLVKKFLNFFQNVLCKK